MLRSCSLRSNASSRALSSGQAASRWSWRFARRLRRSKRDGRLFSDIAEQRRVSEGSRDRGLASPAALSSAGIAVRREAHGFTDERPRPCNDGPMDNGARPSGVPRSDARMTVVVVTRNRVGSLARTLARLEELPERPHMIMVDNASTDGTQALVARCFQRVKVIALHENAGPRARTLGAQAAHTRYVAFADDDSWWRPGALALGARILDEHPGLGLLAARTLVGPERLEDPLNDVMRRSSLGRHPELPGPFVLGFLACAAIVRRSAFLEAGGFTESAMGFEETPLALEMARHGWAAIYLDELVAEHHPRPGPERASRRGSHLRNELAFAWRRRPFRIALARTLRAFRQGLTERAALEALVETARQARRLHRERSVIDEGLESSLRRMSL
jgi:GT2 family glycosyltransferase